MTKTWRTLAVFIPEWWRSERQTTRVYLRACVHACVCVCVCVCVWHLMHACNFFLIHWLPQHFMKEDAYHVVSCKLFFLKWPETVYILIIVVGICLLLIANFKRRCYPAPFNIVSTPWNRSMWEILNTHKYRCLIWYQIMSIDTFTSGKGWYFWHGLMYLMHINSIESFKPSRSSFGFLTAKYE